MLNKISWNIFSNQSYRLLQHNQPTPRNRASQIPVKRSLKKLLLVQYTDHSNDLVEQKRQTIFQAITHEATLTG